MREITAALERNRIRIAVRHDEDEIVVHLKLNEAQELSEKLSELVVDFEKRKKVRID